MNQICSQPKNTLQNTLNFSKIIIKSFSILDYSWNSSRPIYKVFFKVGVRGRCLTLGNRRSATVDLKMAFVRKSNLVFECNLHSSITKVCICMLIRYVNYVALRDLWPDKQMRLKTMPYYIDGGNKHFPS